MRISADNDMLQYSGRIDFDDEKAPVLVYAGSFVRMRFSGTSVKAVIANHRSCWTNYLGYILDGRQGKFALDCDSAQKTYTIAENLDDAEHELLLFKRMDSCHTFTFYGFLLDEGAALLPVPPLPRRKLEVFGDSVSCGEVSEAVEYAGRPDPEHDGQYSNSWYSYSWLTARKLDAEVHITAQGGISLLDGTGWFHAPDYLGVESCFDKIEYNDECGPTKAWDFSKYQPHVVVVAIGQNDSNPEDYMAEDYDGEKAKNWRMHYQAFVEKLMEIYPHAQIILATTILCHHPNWDRAIEEAARSIDSDRVHHFLYRKNGIGTPGHIRIPEAEEMADELSAYINSLGNVWGEYRLNYENALANRGSWARIKEVMRRAKAGEALTLGFLGGSITQGSLASQPALCYAYRVYEWWCRTFPNASFTYVNAGIGATDSQFGCARAESDLLAYEPDFVIIEFSVNDLSTPHYLETYEGLVRKVLSCSSRPAVLLVHNVCYDNGANAQLMHGKIARHYDLPSVSMQSCIYPELVAGRIENREITPDDLHPNDKGHALVASVITYYLERMAAEAAAPETVIPETSVQTAVLSDIPAGKTTTAAEHTEREHDDTALPVPLTENSYQDSVRYQNANSAPLLSGFVKDGAPQAGITDSFKNGWFASEKGAKIEFDVEGSCIGVQYRKTMQLPAPVARLVIDGDVDHALRLDANFDENWGDKLVLDTAMEHGKKGAHHVAIELVETHESDRLPFYLVSLIASGR